MSRYLSCFWVCALIWTAGASSLQAGADNWKFGLNSNWESGGAWVDGSTPGNADTATLGFASTYTVTFGAPPVAIQNLTVNNGGNVTFASSGGAKTLNITSATGAQELDLGANTTLILGTSGNVLNVTAGTNIVTQSGSDLEARFGSHLTAVDFSTGGLGGSLVVNGAGSLLTLTGSGEHLIGGANGGGSLALQNSSASASITGSLGIADAMVASSGNLSLTGNSTLTLAGDLKVASQGVAGSNGTVSLAGATTALTQAAGGSVVVGSFSGGAATVNLAGTTSATLTTGTGGLGIRTTGTVNVGGSGTVGNLNVNGDLFVSGGGTGAGLNVASGSTFTQAAGRMVNVSGGGQIILNSAYLAPAGQSYFLDGTGSKFQVNGGDFGLGNGAAASVTNGATLSGQTLSVGTNGNGTLTVSGPGSLATATGFDSQFGLSHSAATVTITSGGTGSFANGLELADSLFADSTATVTVKSGGHLNTGSLSLANSPSANESPTATLTVTDANSTVNIGAGNTLQLSGPFINGNATLNVQNNASLTVGAGGGTTTYPGAVLNISGGYADLKTLTYNGGLVNFTAGSLSYLGNLEVGVGGLLGTDVTLGASQQLTLSGTTTIDPFHTLALSGGTLSTGGLVVNGTFNFTGGTLEITGANGLTIGSGNTFGPVFTVQAGRNLIVDNQTAIASGAVLAVETGAGFSTGSMSVSGEFDLNGGVATANIRSLVNTGLIRGDGRIVSSGGANALANSAGGEIRAESGKRLQFIGNNSANSGLINLQGGTAEFTQPLTNGATGQIVGRGTLKVGGTGLTNLGNIALASGVTDIFGDVNNNTGSATKGISISGNAAVNFWDDVTNTSGLFKVNSGSTATFFGTFSGLGITGNASDIHFEADISPGFSPASINMGGNVSFGAGSKLKIELGGTTPGTQYDQIHVGGNLSLDGALQVLLINNFTPSLGNTFDILDWGTKTGTFSSISFPMLPAGLTWDSSQFYTTGIISVAGNNTHVGDFNHDGHVNAADIPAMLVALADLNAYKSANSLSNSDLVALGDVNGDGGVSNADVQALLDLLKSGGGSLAAVPEPSSISLAAIACLVCGCCCYPRRRLRSAAHPI
jgi:hypothetical protein